MTCPHCLGTGMVPDTPSHTYAPFVQGWTRCTCPVREQAPTLTMSQIDDQIAAMRAADRGTKHDQD